MTPAKPLARPALSTLPSDRAALREIVQAMARQMAEDDAKGNRT